MFASLSRRARLSVSALAIAAAFAPLPAMQAHAQSAPAFNPCTGVSVDQASLRNVLAATNTPINTAVQGKVNALVNLPLLGGLLSPLAVDIGAIVDAAVTSNPLALRVLDTAGNPVLAGACNIVSDGLTLATQGGISIGGNVVSGLGLDGLAAAAGTTDSIALGNNAQTGGLALGALAIGTGANVTVTNGVALGSGSIADRAGLTGYLAAGIAGTSHSVGTLSVGAAGALRQITNLAPGSALTDAATVGQVQGALDLAAAVNVAVGVNANAITGLTSTVGTLGGQMTGATNAIGGLTTDVAGLTTSLGTLTAQVTGNGSAIAGLTTDLATLGGQVAGNTGAIGGLATSVGALSGQVTNNTSAIVGLGTDVSGLTGAVGTLTGQVAGNTGAIAGLSGDLATLAGQVAGNTGAITAIDGTIAALDGRVAINADAIVGLTTDVSGLTTGLAALDGRVTGLVGDVADLTTGLATLDGRVTGLVGDVADLATGLADNTAAIADLDVRVLNNTTLIGDIDARVLDNTTSIANIDARVLNNTNLLGDVDARVTVNSTAITNLQTQVANVPVGYVQDGNPAAPSAVPTNTAAMIGVGGTAVRLTNVAAGAVAAGSSDAVNGEQLAATNAALAANVLATATNQAAITALDASAVKYDNAARTAITLAGAGGTRLTNVAPGAVAAGSSDAVNGAQLAATNAQVTQNTNAITTINNNLAGSTVVAVQYSNPGTPTVSNGGTITNDVTLIGAAAAPVTIHNVGAGRDATDAVNLGQVQSQLASAVASAQSYSDSRLAAALGMVGGEFARIDFDMGELRQDAMAGVAGSMAFAGIPQTMEIGKSMLGGAVAHYRGETAVAFGFSSSLGDGKAAVKVGGSVDSRGYVGVTAGGGIAF